MVWTCLFILVCVAATLANIIFLLYGTANLQHWNTVTESREKLNTSGDFLHNNLIIDFHKHHKQCDHDLIQSQTSHSISKYIIFNIVVCLEVYQLTQYVFVCLTCQVLYAISVTRQSRVTDIKMTITSVARLTRYFSLLSLEILSLDIGPSVAFSGLKTCWSLRSCFSSSKIIQYCQAFPNI